MENFDFQKELERNLSDFVDEELERLKSHKIIGAVKDKDGIEMCILDISKNQSDTIIEVLGRSGEISEFLEVAIFTISEDSETTIVFKDTLISVEGLEYLSRVFLEIKEYIEKNIGKEGEKRK